jgi:hypothetical protein
MSAIVRRAVVGVVITGLAGFAANAQSVKLPIAEGVWVKTDTQCKAAYIAYVYAKGRFGSVYFYGPNQTMGPANESEVLSHIGKGKNGFTVVNDGPIEVAARPNGQALVRAVSLSEGVQWTETIRLCPVATLSNKLRSGLARESLIAPVAR